MKRFRLQSLLLVVAGVYALVSVVVLSGVARAQTLTQGYAADGVIQRGTIVSLTAEDPKKVEIATLNNQDRMHGVVVSPNDASFTLSNDEEKTFVATKGRFEVLVSNENGVIQNGDFIAISRVSGIGKKAGEDQIYIIGKALSGFDGESGVLSTTEVKNGNDTAKVTIGRIQMDVGVAGNPLFKPTKANLPGFLERIAERIAQKPVTPIRIYISLAVLFASSVVTGVLLYAGVRSAIISIGRNPLSKRSVTKSVIQVVITGIIILLLGVFGVYLLLRI